MQFKAIVFLSYIKLSSLSKYDEKKFTTISTANIKSTVQSIDFYNQSSFSLKAIEKGVTKEVYIKVLDKLNIKVQIIYTVKSKSQ